MIVLTLLIFPGLARAQDAIDLKVAFPKGQQQKIVATYEHVGDVIVLPENDTPSPANESLKTKSLPLTVKAKLVFFQRAMSDLQAVRYFETAGAEIKLENGTASPSLLPVNRLIIARLKVAAGERVEMASVSDTLVQSELELIQNAADPLALPKFLSRKNVKTGDKWKPSNDSLAKILGVYKISQSDVLIRLDKSNGQSARLNFSGTVVAEVDDVTTQMKINGAAIVNLDTGIVSAFKLGIRQSRGPGQIAPGFVGSTSIDLRVSGASNIPQLSNKSLASQTKNRKIRQRLKWESGAGNFVLTYEPRWKMIAAEQEAAVLRFVDRGSLLTQCNIVQLPSRPANSPLMLADYKSEIAKMLTADKAARMVSAKQVLTPAGLTALRIVVSGVEEDLPVNWYYYHVSAQDGRQVTFVFTLAQAVSTQIDSVADQLVNEFSFLDNPKKVARAGTAPTPAPRQPGAQQR